MNPTLELLRRHSTCRDYTDEAVPQEALEELVRTAQQCATDATGQLYSLFWVRSPSLRARIQELLDQEFVRQAPCLLIVLLDTRRLRLLLEHRGESLGMKPAVSLLFGLTDAALFAQSLVVAAESQGYGTCFLGSVQNHGSEITKRLGLPAGVVPLYGLTLGRPRHALPPKPRIPTRLVLHADAYRDASPADLDAVYAEMSKATRSGDWLNPIRKYFAAGGIMQQREEDWRRLLTEQGFDLRESRGGANL